MQTNQVFKILIKYGTTHDAKIILQHFPKMSWIRAHYVGYLLRKKMPVAKIIHEKWFYGIPFYTNTHTLDPRPDTETIIDTILSEKHLPNTKILDLGTGTGCIICTLIKNISDSYGTAIDKSYYALRVANKNIKSLGLSPRIRTFTADFSDSDCINTKYDIIVSNPPYIAINDKRVNDGAQHDPDIALYAKQNGLAAYISIAQNAINWIRPDGKIYLEIGSGMMGNVKKIFHAYGWKFVRAVKDLSGKYRVVVFSLV